MAELDRPDIKQSSTQVKGHLLYYNKFNSRAFILDRYVDTLDSKLI